MEGQCAFCGLSNQVRICKNPDTGKGPQFCSTLLYPECIEKAAEEYQSEEIHTFAVKCRIEETIDFCKSMDYKRIGLAFCGALHREAAVVAKIFRAHGLETVSVMCKVGGIDKAAIGIQEEEKLHPGRFEAMCNPIAQAEILNQADTDFNVVIGLCVGHDSLFLSHRKKMCTVLAVKDRLLGHNPLAAVYTNHSYYGFLNNGD